MKSKGEEVENKGKGEKTTIEAIEVKQINLKIVGKSHLICNRFSDEAVKTILDKQMGTNAKAGRERKNPEEDYKRSLYETDDGRYGFPASGFKNAAVAACSFTDMLTKVEARGALFVMGDMIPIKGTPTMRKDTVRVGRGAADVRFRGEFKEWECTLPIRYNARKITPQQIAQLFQVAGFSVGIGDWRPQKNGSFGMFEVASSS